MKFLHLLAMKSPFGASPKLIIYDFRVLLKEVISILPSDGFVCLASELSLCLFNFLR